MTATRAALVTWSAAVTALAWLLPPGDWRLLAVVPALGTYGVWRATAAPGRHAGPGGTSPLPGPAYAAPGPDGRALGPVGCSCGVQSGEHKLWCGPADAELDWQARNELPPEISPALVALADDGFVADIRAACEPNPPYLPAVPLSAAEGAAAGEVPGPAADGPHADPPPGASPADGWDEASLAQLRDAPSVLDKPQWHYKSERLADTGEIAMAPIRAEWAAQLDEQDADARSFCRQLEQSALHYRLGLAGARS